MKIKGCFGGSCTLEAISSDAFAIITAFLLASFNSSRTQDCRWISARFGGFGLAYSGPLHKPCAAPVSI
jgi:hypothetical protein